MKPLYYEVHITLDLKGMDAASLDALPPGWWSSHVDRDDGNPEVNGFTFYTNQFDSLKRASRAMHFVCGLATGLGIDVKRAKIEGALYDSKYPQDGERPVSGGVV